MSLILVRGSLMMDEIKAIVLCCSSPRCGSTLLVQSLGAHPELASAGELFIHTLRGGDIDGIRRDIYGSNTVNFAAPMPEHLEYVRRCRDRFSIFKVFPVSQISIGMLTLLCRDALKVFLYRRDEDAQAASWGKACQTGQWHMEQAGPDAPSTVPVNPLCWIAAGREMFETEADVMLCYEDMVADWAATMRNLQEWMGVREVRDLPMATRKMLR